VNQSSVHLAGIPGLVAIDHVGIAVENLDSAIAFYITNFGAVLTHRETNSKQRVEEAMIQIGTSTLQLLAATDPESTIAKFIEKSGVGIQQLAYRVTDIAAAVKAARALGIRVLYEEEQIGTAGAKINFLHPRDCGGVLVELVEPVKN
jgi:methylmalonyl-CoA/ethylmalonyl-CoA epimerase